jgi:uncharacterized oligopeptide transporter (OPT) family protein
MFGGELPFEFLLTGVALGLLFSGFDGWLKAKHKSFRAPPLALALGLYLPLELSASVLLGGLVVGWSRRGQGTSTETHASGGLLMGAGLITGEALVGVVLAGLVLGWGGLARLRLGSSSTLVTAALVLLTLFALARPLRLRSSHTE